MQMQGDIFSTKYMSPEGKAKIAPHLNTLNTSIRLKDKSKKISQDMLLEAMLNPENPSYGTDPRLVASELMKSTDLQRNVAGIVDMDPQPTSISGTVAKTLGTPEGALGLLSERYPLIDVYKAITEDNSFTDEQGKVQQGNWDDSYTVDALKNQSQIQAMASRKTSFLKELKKVATLYKKDPKAAAEALEQVSKKTPWMTSMFGKVRGVKGFGWLSKIPSAGPLTSRFAKASPGISLAFTAKGMFLPSDSTKATIKDFENQNMDAGSTAMRGVTAMFDPEVGGASISAFLGAELDMIKAIDEAPEKWTLLMPKIKESMKARGASTKDIQIMENKMVKGGEEHQNDIKAAIFSGPGGQYRKRGASGSRDWGNTNRSIGSDELRKFRLYGKAPSYFNKFEPESKKQALSMLKNYGIMALPPQNMTAEGNKGWIANQYWKDLPDSDFGESNVSNYKDALSSRMALDEKKKTDPNWFKVRDQDRDLNKMRRWKGMSIHERTAEIKKHENIWGRGSWGDYGNHKPNDPFKPNNSSITRGSGIKNKYLNKPTPPTNNTDTSKVQEYLKSLSKKPIDKKLPKTDLSSKLLTQSPKMVTP